MSARLALIIGNTEYIDPGLAQLTAPGKDTEDFARVLKDPEVCAFDDVNVLLNQTESVVREAIDEFFHEKRSDDLLVLYFSGHGVRDELGALYLAVKNTNRFRLRSTAIKSDFIREAMDQSRSRRQVLILDCCNSGAFSQGTKAATGVSIGTATAFEAGYGRIILTASDSTQFAWEGNQVIGETQNSLFTHFLVQGLEGEADLDGDGNIAVDELYDYAYDQVKLVTPKQTPSKFSSKQQGEIILRQHIRVEDIRPVSLPSDLLDEIEDTRPYVREAAVHKLEKIVKAKNIALARSAREALEKIAVDDNTTRRVSLLATQVLDTIRQAEREEEERRAREEAERISALKAEEERLAREKAEAEQRAKQEAERLVTEQKAKAERKARREAKRLATLRAKEEQERLAREKSEADREAKEAERVLTEQRASEERKAKDESEHLAAIRAKEEQERLAREKSEAAQKAEEAREARKKAMPISVVQTKESPIAAGTLIKLQTMIPQRFLYAGLAVVLLVGLALLGRSYSLRNMSPESTPAPSETKEQSLGINSPMGETLPATNTVSVTPPPETTTISPSPVSTASVGTSVSIVASRAYLYKGPALEHGLVVQKPYLRGEAFTILARNPSRLWLFGETSDGNQGWLYFEWVDRDIDALIIPTASFIPTAPVPATRRPGGSGGPTSTPCTNFC